MSEIPEVFKGHPDSASSAYDPLKFYTASTNGHDHSEQVKVKIPPALKGRIAGLIESKVVPQYRTYNDFARDAMHHRAQWLAENYGDWELADILARERMKMAVEEFRQRQLDFMSLTDELRKAIDDLQRDQDWYAGRTFFDVAESHLDGFTAVQREKLEALISQGREMCDRGERLGF